MEEKLIFDISKCGGAGECLEVCPNNVWKWKEITVSFLGMKMRKKIPYPEYQDKCILCGLCVKICPTGAVKFKK
ncbi:MAG: ferredoxin family protein [Elusimicrobiota bacterium]|nr:ferredoxin family protein [Elusimicrobiota bacterium]